MRSQFFIAEAIQLDANPALHPDIRWLEIFLARSVDQRGLHTGRRRKPYRDMAIVVVIIREHCIDFLIYKKSRLSMRELFGSPRQSATKPPHSPQMFFAENKCWYLRQRTCLSCKIVPESEP